MSTRHRVALAMKKGTQILDYGYDVFTDDKTATFVFDSGRSAQIVSEMLRLMFKRKTLIHKGRKP